MVLIKSRAFDGRLRSSSVLWLAVATTLAPSRVTDSGTITPSPLPPPPSILSPFKREIPKGSTSGAATGSENVRATRPASRSREKESKNGLEVSAMKR